VDMSGWSFISASAKLRRLCCEAEETAAVPRVYGGTSDGQLTRAGATGGDTQVVGYGGSLLGFLLYSATKAQVAAEDAKKIADKVGPATAQAVVRLRAQLAALNSKLGKIEESTV
jgi:hypothetical protein